MSVYYDWLTIEKLVGQKIYREKKEFTLEELAQYDGSNGKPAYTAVNGIVYDVSLNKAWGGGTHFGLEAGRDFTMEFQACHGGMSQILVMLPKAGVLKAGGVKIV